MADLCDFTASSPFHQQHPTDLSLSFTEPAVDTSNNSTFNKPLDESLAVTVIDGHSVNSLTVEMIQSNFSDLRYTASNNGVTYVRLTLSNMQLSDISAVSTFIHIKHLNISHNMLKDLSPLSNLRHLVNIDASYNRITNMACFTPSVYLLSIDLSYNEIEEIPQQLKVFTSLTKLILNGNQLTTLSGLKVLHNLTYLSLSDNRIDSMNDIGRLPLKILIMVNNNLTSLAGIESLHLLEVVNLAGNQITSLEGISCLEYLYEINLEDNTIVDFKEISHLEKVTQLGNLNLIKNPVHNDPSYKQFLLVNIPKLLKLDNQDIDHHEKVSAMNRYMPSDDLLASQNHMQHVVKSVKKLPRVNFSTLTEPDEPYPMLVLCGPSGSGKELYSQQLVEEFPSFFGLGVSHTTRLQGANESHGRDYYFINETTFKRAADCGEFIQTSYISGSWYGLTFAAVEQTAQQGLACVCHLTLEDVFSLKRCHFEPRYILLLPLNNKILEERIQVLSHEDIHEVKSQVEKYLSVHRSRPGFFDATINTDRLNEGYNILRTIVMAYGGISPDTPLTLSLSASRPTTRQTSSSLSSYGLNIDGDIDNIDNSLMSHPQGHVTVSRSAPVASSNNDHHDNEYDKDYRLNHHQLNVIAQSWSRPSTCSDTRSLKKTLSNESDFITKREDDN